MTSKNLTWTLGSVVLPLAVSLAVGQLRRDEFGAADRGRKLFRTNCAPCHKLEELESPRYGPSLHEIGKIAGTRKPGMSAEEYILESMVSPGAFRAEGIGGAMPGNIWMHMTDDELRALIALLMSRGGDVDPERIARLEIPERPPPGSSLERVDREKIDEGEALFRGKGKCINCHKLRPDPDFTLRAPSLLDMGSLPAETIRKSIAEPSAEIAAGYGQVNVPLKSLTLVTGRLVRESEQGLDLLRVAEDGTVERVFVPRADIADTGPVASEVSAMPPVEDVLTPAEIDALVAFLRNRQGGYAGYGRIGMFQYKKQ